MSTTAIEREDDFVINGAKWFITNLQHSQSYWLLKPSEGTTNPAVLAVRWICPTSR